ncbi:MAG TPA: DUF433 domain-containing protein, partial [Planctomycetaceae bacterium]|nr:DUF433 domain-containing protein [Planctomycetaceae bacterium]
MSRRWSSEWTGGTGFPPRGIELNLSRRPQGRALLAAAGEIAAAGLSLRFSAMSNEPKQWRYLGPKTSSTYKQLFIKGRRIAARTLYGMHMNEEEPMTPEEIAADYDLPLEAVLEAIEYCESDPPEIREDWEREEALMQATGMSDPDYKYNPTPRVIPTEERARILASHSEETREVARWKYLDRKPGSVYKQLFIKGRNIAARTLYGHYMSEEEPETPEEIAANYDLPLDVVLEAIAYCQTDPPEIRED